MTSCPTRDGYVEHLLVFGFVEAVVTALVVMYLQQSDPGLLYKAPQTTVTEGESS